MRGSFVRNESTNFLSFINNEASWRDGLLLSSQKKHQHRGQVSGVISHVRGEHVLCPHWWDAFLAKIQWSFYHSVRRLHNLPSEDPVWKQSNSTSHYTRTASPWWTGVIHSYNTKLCQLYIMLKTCTQHFRGKGRRIMPISATYQDWG